MIIIKTNIGNIELELFSDKAPKTCANFLKLIKAKYYNDTIFHRVIKGFMIQGGGLTSDMSPKKDPILMPIQNEADNGLSNQKYTIAMARTMAPHSATSQFFINTIDSTFLDFKEKSPEGWGYCVFGKVTKGFDVVDKIEAVSTTRKPPYRDVPKEDIVILEITEE